MVRRNSGDIKVMSTVAAIKSARKGAMLPKPPDEAYGRRAGAPVRRASPDLPLLPDPPFSDRQLRLLRRGDGLLLGQVRRFGHDTAAPGSKMYASAARLPLYWTTTVPIISGWSVQMIG
jgi:hypothetical protein